MTITKFEQLVADQPGLSIAEFLAVANATGHGWSTKDVRRLARESRVELTGGWKAVLPGLMRANNDTERRARSWLKRGCRSTSRLTSRLGMTYEQIKPFFNRWVATRGLVNRQAECLWPSASLIDANLRAKRQAKRRRERELARVMG